jgi:predicted phage baseplate assembly protein
MNTATVCLDDARREAVRARPELNGLDYVEVGDDQLSLIAYFLGKAPEQIVSGRTQYFRVEGGQRIRDIKVIDVDVTRQRDPDLDDYVLIRVDKAGDFSTYTLRLIGVENIDPFYDHVEFSFKVDCPSDLDCAQTEDCPPDLPPEPEINYLAKDYASFRQLILDRLALIMPDWTERHVPDLGITLVEVLAYVGDYLSYYQDAVATEAYLDTARQRISVRRHARLVDYVLHEGCNARAWLCFNTDTDLLGDNALKPRDVYFITSVRDAADLDRVLLSADELRPVPPHLYEVYEAVHGDPIELYKDHAEIEFYTWGERECCLPRGSTSATLIDAIETPPIERRQDQKAQYQAQANEPQRRLHLKVGDVLIFEEVLGPQTGVAADADPSHRHAVRLTKVTPGVDPLNGQPVVEIEWGDEDALPFALCISSTTDAGHGCRYVAPVSVARGNVILVDHGLTIEPCEELGDVPVAATETECYCEEHPSDVKLIAGRYRPRLKERPLTYHQALPVDDSSTGYIASAASWLQQDVRRALPHAYLTSILPLPDEDYAPISWAALADQTALVDALYAAGVTPRCYANGVPLSPRLYDEYQEADAAKAELAKALENDPNNQKLKDEYQKAADHCDEVRRTLISDLMTRLACWIPQIDLLDSGPDDRHFVVEIDNEGVAWLRFGDDTCGQQPEAASTFYASYRVGNGSIGNVGAESITQIVFRRDLLSGVTLTVRNPLPARGGTNPEPIAEAKLFAPSAFRNVLMRAITADDYAAIAQREFATKVQRAAAVLAWTGSWYEADVAVDTIGRESAPPELLAGVDGILQRYRRIGHDLEVEAARYVPIELELTVCVLPHFLRGHVKAALLAAFSNRQLVDGRLGFFHADNLSFGEGVYLSQIVAAAQAVPGVESVRVTKLNRLYEPPNRELENGVLPLGPLEVAQLDNDPSFPERGKLTLVMMGGR